MSRTKDVSNAIPFEEALKRLEEIVRHLEAGDLTLDESLKAFEEGIKWSRLCEQRLAEAKGKVEVLVKEANGEVMEKPFVVTDDRLPATSATRPADKGD